MIMFLVLYLCFGLVDILLAIPLILEIVKPNYFYGYRVRATLENPKIWYAVNRHFGQRFLVAGILLMIAAIGLYFIPGMNRDTYTMACMIAFVVPLMIAMAQSKQYLKSLERNFPK